MVEAIEAAFAPARASSTSTRIPTTTGRCSRSPAAQGELARRRSWRRRAAAVERIDLSAHEGVHPHVGALDVVPVVYLDEESAAPPAPRRSPRPR